MIYSTMPRNLSPIHLRGQDVLRFERKFVKSDGCWNWNAVHDKNGYGQFRLLGRTERVHRIAYVVYVGPIPPGFSVLHTCDNPRCVNPQHLWLGTQADNLRDMANKRRSTYGERNPQAKLTVANVLRIRELYRRGRQTQQSIALIFGVADSAICNIINGKRWGHITEVVNHEGT